MNLNSLEEKLNRLSEKLTKDTSLKTITESIKNNNSLDEDDKIKVRQEYYQTLPKYEKLYQIKNDKYKDLIQQFSLPYLELTEFYVGPELPREHYLQSKKDVIELYMLFGFFAMWEPYINAFHKKFGCNSS